MIEKITLDMLTQESVSVKKQNYVDLNGEIQPVGQPWRRAYVNSVSGRQAVQNEIPEPQSSAILAVWGDTPRINEAQ